MRKLAVAQTAEAIDPTFAQTYTERRPGFQIGPDVPAIACLEILQGHMRSRLGLEKFTFNAAFGTTRPGSADFGRLYYEKEGQNDTGAHIDESQARRELGIVLHDNVQGVGRVILQLAKPGITELETDENERPIIYTRDVESKPFEGELYPGIKTVFFEGFTAVSGLVEVTMGATIHDFRSDGPREWTRYSWEPMGG